MYFYQKLKELVWDNSISDSKFYRLSSVEIDNPVSDTKMCVPAFTEVVEKKPDYVDLHADAFSLQTLLDAGVNLKPVDVISSSFLRETEKFVDSLKNAKI